MTMMMFAKPAAAVFALLSLGPLAAEKLVLKPAPDFHSYTQYCGDDAILFLRVDEPPSTDFCEMQTTMLGQPEGETDMQTMLGPPENEALEPVCGGTFFMNLALYDGLEFSFQAPEGASERRLSFSPMRTTVSSFSSKLRPTVTLIQANILRLKEMTLV